MLGWCLAINAYGSVSIHVNKALGAPPHGEGD